MPPSRLFTAIKGNTIQSRRGGPCGRPDNYNGCTTDEDKMPAAQQARRPCHTVLIIFVLKAP